MSLKLAYDGETQTATSQRFEYEKHKLEYVKTIIADWSAGQPWQTAERFYGSVEAYAYDIFGQRVAVMYGGTGVDYNLLLGLPDSLGNSKPKIRIYDHINGRVAVERQGDGLEGVPFKILSRYPWRPTGLISRRGLALEDIDGGSLPAGELDTGHGGRWRRLVDRL